MANLISAGLLMCRFHGGALEYFLVHPGGPFFRKKEKGVWSIPKGIPEDGEELLAAAIREFQEETALTPAGPFHPLGSIVQKRGKIVHAWSFLGEWDPATGIVSNKFSIEWPPHSGTYQEFAEQDKAEWMSLGKAKEAIIQEQIPLLERCLKVYC